METPMVIDMRKLRDSDFDPLDSSLYHNLIISLRYLFNTRLNIFFVVKTLIQFWVGPGHEHSIDANHILIYLCGTLNYGFRYASNNDLQLHGFTNSDWAGSVDDRKITSGVCFNLGSTMIS
jgi:hypothetical protein